MNLLLPPSNKKQINERNINTTLIMDISIGAPQKYETQRHPDDPELRKGMGLWGFKGEKAVSSWEGEKGNAPL